MAEPAFVSLHEVPIEMLLALNNAHQRETSPLDERKLSAMLATSFYARGIGTLDAMLIGFDQDAAYDSVNFLWFRARCRRFVYIDRVITAPGARGRGYGRALYEDMIAQGRAAGHDRIFCEVNRLPPNPVSDAFHAALGFTELGEASIYDGRTVRYLGRPIDA